MNPDIKAGDLVRRVVHDHPTPGGPRVGDEFLVERVSGDAGVTGPHPYWHSLDYVELVQVAAAGAPAAPPDAVNPAHYQLSSGAQLIDFVERLPFARGNAVKYLVRAGVKEGADELEDLRKALWYVQREVARVEAQRAAS